MKALQILVAAVAIFWAVAATAQESYKRLSGEEIHSEIIGRDITDEFHWWKYFREDGAIVAIDLGRETVGRWTVENDRLCMAEEPAAEPECLQVWIHHDEVILRMESENVRLVGYVRDHKGG